MQLILARITILTFAVFAPERCKIIQIIHFFSTIVFFPYFFLKLVFSKWFFIHKNLRTKYSYSLPRRKETNWAYLSVSLKIFRVDRNFYQTSWWKYLYAKYISRYLENLSKAWKHTMYLSTLERCTSTDKILTKYSLTKY